MGRYDSGLCSSLRTPSGGQGHFSQDTDVNGNVSPTTSKKSLGFDNWSHHVDLESFQMQSANK